MTALVKKAGGFAESEIHGEIVLLSLGTGDFFALTGPAAATWRLIDGTRDRTALIWSLGQQFEAEEMELAADLDGFIASLIHAGFLAEN
jgi:hypothetical protein